MGEPVSWRGFGFLIGLCNKQTPEKTDVDRSCSSCGCHSESQAQWKQCPCRSSWEPRDFVIWCNRCNDASGSSTCFRNPGVDPCPVVARIGHTVCTSNLVDARMSAMLIESSDGIFSQGRHTGRWSSWFSGCLLFRLSGHVEQPLQSVGKKYAVVVLHGRNGLFG
jgi:hypothetical protein